MNLQITEQKINHLLSRKEVRAKLSYEQATPSKEELKKQIASAVKANSELLVVKSVYPGYGDRNAEVLFYVYDKPEVMKKLEREPKKPAKKTEEKA